MVKGIANAHVAAMVAARADRPFKSVGDMWRRASLPTAALVQMAQADAFLPSLRLARRDALWAIKAMLDEALPLFAAVATHDDEPFPEIHEPRITLRPLTGGGAVVADYTHIGLSLRSHPVAYLRNESQQQGIFPCNELMSTRDGKLLETAGIVLVRQRPGSANGVMFINIEDETGIANLVVWPHLYEK